jgi:hypothetical protein
VPAETNLVERAWWERVGRAAARRGEPVGTKGVMSDWCHDVLEVYSNTAEGLELVGEWGHCRWQPIPPERCTEEYKQREIRRLNDELGRKLGVGPMP